MRARFYRRPDRVNEIVVIKEIRNMRSTRQPSFFSRLFFKLFSDELIDVAYQGILGRPADAAGKIAHRELLLRTGSLKDTLHILSHGVELAIQLPYSDIVEHRKSVVRTYLKGLPHTSTSNKKILLLGNCQVRPLSRLMLAMCGDADVAAIELVAESIRRLDERENEISKLISESDVIFFHLHGEGIRVFEKNYPEAVKKVRYIPRVTFSAFHPDIDYVEDAQHRQLSGPMGPYQSAIAFFGWKNALSVSQTLDLFREDIYESLGYFAYGDASRDLLLLEGDRTGIPMAGIINNWSSRGCWMHSMNHPKLFALADVARILLERENIETLPGVEEFVEDEMNFEVVWPIYPEIAKKLGLVGYYVFKRPTESSLRGMPVQMLSLEQFIEESFETFSKYPRDELRCDRINSKRFEDLKFRLNNSVNSTRVAVAIATPNVDVAAESTPKQSPYTGLPDYQFWRRAIERMPMADVNPVVNVRFELDRKSKVATAGSCFAQHISRTLEKKGLTYFVAEPGNHLSKEEASRRHYGVFSARYGNLYTARQLVQLFDRAFGRFRPLDTHWARGDGRLVDPFRPQIEVDGFDSVQSIEHARDEHFALVREMFEQLDVFVFTLGLTEAWRNRHDGAVFPLAPGVVAGDIASEQYEFVNFGVSDIVADMQAFIDRLLVVNANAKVILTVSPVPLIATYENQHVLVASTYSKSVLRAAAGEIALRNSMCDYFPSFEIITGSYNRGAYFESDLRSVTAEGVDHVMRLFLSHYVGDNHARGSSETNATSNDDIRKELALTNEIICDEEAIDPVDKG